MTDYSRLLDEGRVKRGRFSRRQVSDCLRIARRDVQTAKAVMESSPEWAFNIAYNAMHQAGRAFMFHVGYRPAGEAHHASVIRFLEIGLGSEYDDTLAVMDRMRRKRNRATYDMVGTISRTEAEQALTAARQFVAEISRIVSLSVH
ncbi:MAG: HEPN domain-containing protein [Planctomycetes bacterium]|nr:HEPN domain-containing protein [Planctomycetota bacterium]